MEIRSWFEHHWRRLKGEDCWAGCYKHPLGSHARRLGYYVVDGKKVYFDAAHDTQDQ